jgi:hypothetical protein
MIVIADFCYMSQRHNLGIINRPDSTVKPFPSILTPDNSVTGPRGTGFWPDMRMAAWPRHDANANARNGEKNKDARFLQLKYNMLLFLLLRGSVCALLAAREL